MKKMALLFMAVLAVSLGALGVLLTRFSKNMEKWEMAWDDKEDDDL